MFYYIDKCKYALHLQIGYHDVELYSMGTLPKTNIDIQNDCLENVSPASHMESFWLSIPQLFFLSWGYPPKENNYTFKALHP